jgi:hypothetical protein
MIPPSPLENDRLEENNTMGTAEILMPNLYSNLTITEDDEDWIQFEVCALGTVDIEVTFEHDLGDIDIELYQGISDFSLLSSGGALDLEDIDHFSLLGGTYHLRIFGYNGETNRYDLTFRITGCDGDEGDDRLEENDTLETAEILTPDLYGDLTITSNDVDWIGFDLCAGGTVNATIEIQELFEDLDLYLYDANGIELSSSITIFSLEEIFYTSQTEQRLYLMIEGYLGSTSSYDLNFEITGCP